MRPTARRLISILAMSVIAAGCAATEPASEAPASAATTVTTSAATTTTSTTTTTLPPGLQPQILEHGFGNRTMVSHDVAHHVTISFETTGSGLDSTMPSRLETTIEGDQRTLYLETNQAGIFEAISDFKGTEGSLSFTIDGTEINQEIDAEEAAEYPMSGPPTLIGTNGAAITGRTGAPALFEDSVGPLDALELFGPVFGPDPVDEGDAWTLELSDPIYTSITVDGTVTAEVETDDGFVFEFEISATAPDLPIETSLEEALANGDLSEGVLAFVDSAILDRIDGGGVFTITQAGLTASGVFDPVAGTVTEYVVRSNVEFDLTMVIADEPVGVEYSTETVSVYTLTDIATATSFEVESVLDRFESDPFDVAYDALPFLPDYGIERIDQDVFDTFVEKFDVTTDDIIAGVSFIRYTDAGTAVDVTAITNGGNFRGDPFVPEALAGYWSDRTPTRVTINGKPAFRTSIDGTEWLFWSSDTHLFVAVGPRAMAADVMGLIIDTDNPYLWVAGDCLDFRDFDGDVPFSPFGQFGLTHCSVNHQVEVLYSETLEDGPDAAYPDDLGDYLNESCGAKFFEHTGAYPLSTSLDMIRYLPNQDEWDRGARYIACVIALIDGDGKVTVDSRLEGAGLEFPIELAVGTCLDNFIPVDCAEPHQAEIIDIATYDAVPGAVRPDFSEVVEELDESCEVPLIEYGVAEGPLEISSGSITDMYLGWDNDLRTYYCMAFAEGDEGFPVDVTGSFADEWEEAPEHVDT